MYNSLRYPFLFVFLMTLTFANGQYNSNSSIQRKINLRPFIIPGILIGYGIIGIESDGLKLINMEVKEEVNEHIDERATIDDFTQYFSIASVFSLDQTGINAVHSYKDRAIILTTAYFLMGATVNTLKYSIKTQRPDRSTFNSFPSGHTATAFMGAELLRQEYKESSPWPGVIGYAVAVSTGMYRIYNDRHWVTDVAAGAGIGIFSTKVAYLVQPLLRSLLSRKKKRRSNVSYAFLPIVLGEQKGVRLNLAF
jgi:membrane-associated phospholipid phosphatase